MSTICFIFVPDMKEQTSIPVEKTIVAMIRHFGVKLLGDCCSDLSLVEFLALDSICKPGDCAVQDVGEKLGFTKSGATRLVDRLEKKGWVLKERSMLDGRVCCISLTNEGNKIYKKVLESFSRRMKGLLSGFSDQEARLVAMALGRISMKIQ
jgi:MarR family transcriptional regulator, organic hydroperoxide resistance regulator